jgi:hypothetical protein
MLSNPRYKILTQQQHQRTITREKMRTEVGAVSTHGVNENVPRAGHRINSDRAGIVIEAIRHALAIAAEQANSQ